MSDNNQYFQVQEHVYINNVFGIFVKGFGDWLRTQMYPRSKDIIIASYEKTIEHYRRLKKDGGPNWSPSFPFISLDPMMDFEPDGAMGNLFSGYPNYERGLASKLYDPVIYKDDNILIAPVLNRYKGTFEINIWCSSIYELIDYRMSTIQTFGGVGIGRIIYPKNIYGYLIIPDEVQYYDYSNAYTGDSYTIDWEANDAESVLVKNINQDKMTFPFAVTPWLKLSSISDGGVKYGGSADELTDHRLIVTVEWECMFPTHLVLLAVNVPPICHRLNIDVALGMRYLPSYDTPIPKELLRIYSDDENETIISKDLLFKKFYDYVITDEDVETISNQENITVTVGENISDCVYLDVFGKYGKLERDIHWKLEDETTLIFYGVALQNIEAEDVFKIIVYKNAVESTLED